MNNAKDKKYVQTYADYLLLFADSLNNLNTIIGVTCDIMKSPRIYFSQVTCRVIKFPSRF